MVADHVIFNPERISIRCCACPSNADWPQQAHVVGVAAYCAAHCPECSPEPPAERSGPVLGIAGEQMELGQWA
ncbi:MAG TPA: hypothetical protein VN579_07450 [Bryobacteraceae bacterium]|nr:hypothetical protein [Bryobacteraceae bacterium]